MPEAQHIVVRQALIVEHDVVGAGNRDEEIHSGGCQKQRQIIHVILIGLGVVRVTDVAAHWDAEQLGAEVVLKPGARDFLSVVKVFGANEADDGINEKRRKGACHSIGPRFGCLLVH